MGMGSPDDPIRVFLVDDDEDDYLLTQGYLAEIPGRCYALEWVADYDEALERICQGEHDVYLIDYQLEARDGVSLLLEALHRGVTSPLILLTGQGEMETDLAAMRAGAADYLEKSHLDPVRLERVIRYACQQKRLEAGLEQKVRERTRELEQEIAVRSRIEAQLREADRLKDDFLATLGHELRNPLVPIRNALGILQLSNLPESSQGPLAILDRQITIMVHLIDDLLDLSRITRGKLHLDCESLQLAEVIQAALEVGQPLLDRAEVACVLQVPADLPTIWGDRIRLAQVFTNLLSNAAKFTPPGGRVEVLSTREGQEVVTRVRDTGIGIPADLLPDVFTMFSQVGRAQAEREDGTEVTPPAGSSQGGLGIGLALVRNFIELHGGSVSVHSEGVGQGTEFLVRLPIRQAAA